MSLPVVPAAVPSSPLPPRYAAWMDELLAGSIPSEKHATCDNCAMCSSGSQPPTGFDNQQADARFYDPDVKCCSFLPLLWNFLVGDLLADDSPEAAAGRATVENRVAAGVAVSPLGLECAPIYATLYRHISSAFGKTRSMRCPHYLAESGRCGVWRHRESTCATWFCKYERGAVGKGFWDRLRLLLRSAEESLAQWCVLELDPGPAAVAALFPLASPHETVPQTARDFDNLADADRQRSLWGRWAGREREFYRAAADLVRPLTWQDVARLGGSRLAVQAKLTREAYQGMVSTDLPDRLYAHPVRFSPYDGQKCVVTTYSQLDPLRIPLKIAQVLHYFDGRPTSEATEAIERDHRLQLAPSLLRKLVDYGVLGPGAGAPERT